MSDTDWVKQMADWSDAELDPELAEYLFEDDVFGKSLKHPLVFDLGCTLPGRANEALAQKKQMLSEALDREDWHTAIFVHERPHRTEALIEYVVGRDEFDKPLSLDTMPPDRREYVEDVWIDSENQHQHLEDWAAIFEVPPGFWLGDKAAYDELPAVVKVFRGDIDDGGYSWTLDKKVAVFFANRFGHADVLTGTVKKEDVWGFLTARSENEVLTYADKVTVTEVEHDA